MGEAPLSLHLAEETRKELERQARLHDVSEAEMVKQVVEDFLGAQAYKREVIAAAVAEAEKGVFISQEAMLDWMDRLDADPDAAPPEPDIFPSPHR